MNRQRTNPGLVLGGRVLYGTRLTAGFDMINQDDDSEYDEEPRTMDDCVDSIVERRERMDRHIQWPILYELSQRIG